MMSNNIFTWSDYERILVAQYITGGHTREGALRCAQGELKAIHAGNHRAHGKLTVPDHNSL
jgi:hypothetical protein